MNFKKRLTLFAFQFPITLVVGVLLYFAYSMRVHEQPRIDWVVAILIALGLDVVLTWLNKRQEKHQQKAS